MVEHYGLWGEESSGLFYFDRPVMVNLPQTKASTPISGVEA